MLNFFIEKGRWTERDIVIISLFSISVRNNEQKELLTNKINFDVLV
jgi:hypothetical protein